MTELRDNHLWPFASPDLPARVCGTPCWTRGPTRPSSIRRWRLSARACHFVGYQPIHTGYIGSPPSNITQMLVPTVGVVTLLLPS